LNRTWPGTVTPLRVVEMNEYEAPLVIRQRDIPCVGNYEAASMNVNGGVSIDDVTTIKPHIPSGTRSEAVMK